MRKLRIVGASLGLFVVLLVIKFCTSGYEAPTEPEDSPYGSYSPISGKLIDTANAPNGVYIDRTKKGTKKLILNR